MRTLASCVCVGSLPLSTWPCARARYLAVSHESERQVEGGESWFDCRLVDDAWDEASEDNKDDDEDGDVGDEDEDDDKEEEFDKDGFGNGSPQGPPPGFARPESMLFKVEKRRRAAS